MIEKIKMAKYGSTFTMEQLIREITLKQDEIIDKVNELDIKLHTVKFFPPKNDKAIKDLLKLLEADNSVGDVIND